MMSNQDRLIRIACDIAAGNDLDVSRSELCSTIVYLHTRVSMERAGARRLADVLRPIVANAEPVPDPLMCGAAARYGVPLADIDAAHAALKQHAAPDGPETNCATQ